MLACIQNITERDRLNMLSISIYLFIDRQFSFSVLNINKIQHPFTVAT